MPPKTKKRKVGKETEFDLLLNERLTEVFFKYQQDAGSDEEEQNENDSMFEDENPKIKVKDIEKVVNEIQLVKWDPAVLVLITEEERRSGSINLEKMKIILMALITTEKQEDDIVYLFNTFSDHNTNLITHESLSRALKQLNIRESADKISLLLAFANEQSFLHLILSEQTHNKPMSVFADKSGINFEKFKGAFIKSTFLASK